MQVDKSALDFVLQEVSLDSPPFLSHYPDVVIILQRHLAGTFGDLGICNFFGILSCSGFRLAARSDTLSARIVWTVSGLRARTLLRVKPHMEDSYRLTGMMTWYEPFQAHQRELSDGNPSDSVERGTCGVVRSIRL